MPHSPGPFTICGSIPIVLISPPSCPLNRQIPNENTTENAAGHEIPHNTKPIRRVSTELFQGSLLPPRDLKFNLNKCRLSCPDPPPSPPPSCKQLTLRKPESHSAVVPKKVSTWYLSSVYGTRNQQPALSSEIWCRWYTWLATIDLDLCQVLTAGHRWMKFVYFTIKHFRDLNLTFHLIIGGIGM